MIGLLMGTLAFASGNNLYSNCNGTPAQQADCRAYVNGAIDTELMFSKDADPLFCFSDKVALTQVKDVVVKYMTDHPANRDRPASELILLSVMEAFPCPK